MSSVWACKRVLSTAVAQLPLILFRRTPTGRERARELRLYRLVHDQPNPETTSYLFWETLVGTVVIQGDAYAYIERDFLKRISALWQFQDPSRMTVERDKVTDELTYTYRPPIGQPQVYGPAEILHLRGMSNDGIKGCSMIDIAREAIGLAAAAEDFGGRMFAGDSTPPGVITHPKTLGPGGSKNVSDSWEKEHKGKRKIAILEEGMEYKQIGIAPEEAQFLETRVFQVAEIARVFGVPPHLIGELSKATYSNIREQSAEFVKYVLQPWLMRIAQQCNSSLLSEREREHDGLYFEHITDALMRGSQAERYAGYAIARQWGWQSANDVLRKENEPELPGKQGDIYMVPVNMVPAGAITQKPPEPVTPPEPPAAEPEPEAVPEEETDGE
jgi:HK97 family phage portal protein